MNNEEKILDYMDGTLSESESGELLHSLSVSPEKRVVLEVLTAIQRAGAEIVLTYHAKDVARWTKAC